MEKPKRFGMITSCLPWIISEENIVNQQIPDEPVPSLPDKVIINILCRLPAENVLQCRQVCRRWKALSSTRDFIDLHLKRATPTLIAQFTESHKPPGPHLTETKEIQLCFIEDLRETTKRSHEPKYINVPFGSIISPGCCYLPNILNFSHDGLLLFRPLIEPSYNGIVSVTVANPITLQKLTLNFPEGSICTGMYSDPHSRDYTVLLFCNNFGERLQYKKRSLRLQSSWKRVAHSPYRPRVYTPPVLLNEALHWIVDQVVYQEGLFEQVPRCREFILVFNTVREDLTVKSHPGDECTGLKLEEMHSQMELVQIHEQLAFSEVDLVEQMMDLWILEDYQDWHWNKRYKIFLNMEVVGRELIYSKERIIPLGILNGELLIHWKTRGLLGYKPRLQWLEREFCDVEQGVAKRYHIKEDIDEQRRTYLLISTKSLVSHLFTMPHI